MTVITEGKSPDKEAGKGKWLANVKGGLGSRSFEISVVRAGYKHGQDSYGWFDENKLLVTHSVAMSAHMPKFMWDKLVRLAHEIAVELNESKNKVFY